MAMNNAERQRRFRERQKEKLRNAGNGPQRTLARMLYDRYVTSPEEYGIDDVSDIPSLVAGDICEIIGIDSVGVGMGVRSPRLDGFTEAQDSDRDAIRACLGGAEYCEAVERYFKEMHETQLRNKGKRKDKREPMPEPPPIPEA